MLRVYGLWLGFRVCGLGLGFLVRLKVDGWVGCQKCPVLFGSGLGFVVMVRVWLGFRGFGLG